MIKKTGHRKTSKAALMLGTSVFSSIGAAASSSASAANEQGTGFWRWIKNSASSFGNTLKNTASYIDDSTGNRISSGANALGSKFKGGTEYAGKKIKDLYHSADNYFDGGISTNANELWEKTKKFGGTVAENANKLEGVLAKGTSAISGATKKAFNYVDGKFNNSISSYAKEGVEKLKNSNFGKNTIESVSSFGNRIAENDLYKKVAPHVIDFVENRARTIGLTFVVGYLARRLYNSYKKESENKKSGEENNEKSTSGQHLRKRN